MKRITRNLTVFSFIVAFSIASLGSLQSEELMFIECYPEELECTQSLGDTRTIRHQNGDDQEEPCICGSSTTCDDPIIQ